MENHAMDITDAEATKLIDWLLERCASDRSHPRYVRDLLIILLMLDAGLRIGELVKLQISDLWFADTACSSLSLSGNITKTHVARTIPISHRIHEAIVLCRQYYWKPAVPLPVHFAFYSATPNYPLSIRHVRCILYSASKAAFGRRIHPHQLRHTFATRLMRKTNLRVVQQLLGHASIQSTQVYTHPNQQDLQTAIENLPK